MRRKKSAEHLEQSALMGWINWEGIKKHPELEMLYAIPNGGYRHAAEAKRLVDEGVKAGMPDLHLPIARRNSNDVVEHSLYIEMKSKNGKLEKHQKALHEKLRNHGNRVEVCFGFEAARAVLIDYLM